MSNPAPPAKQGQILPTGQLPSLAPTDVLNPEDSSFKAYYDHLNAIFSDPALRNIALIGNRGSGKSSILHSYDRHRPNKTGDFLFVSLIDFENTGRPDAKTPPAAQPDSDKTINKQGTEEKTEAKKAQKLEYSLLCQILARCTAQDLTGSSLSGIPAEPISLARVPHYLMVLFLVCFPVIFHEPFGALIRVVGVPETGRVVIKALCYVLLCGTLFIGLSWLLNNLLSRLRLQKFTFKSTHAQAELALDSGKYCLDQFKFELIYILSRISNKIGHTVVFEDMERLDRSTCIELMTKLRELNSLINTYRQTQDPALAQKPLRFVYAMSDEVFDCEIRTKFFDFIMPVVPALNATNAEQILKNRLHDIQTKVDGKRIQKLIPIIAPQLTDYRTLQSVLGEYQMLLHLYAASMDDLKEYAVSDEDTGRLLALAVYKVLFPQEYHTAFTDTGNAILPLPPAEKYRPSLTEMAKALFNEGYLDNTTLRMIGYSEAQIKDQWWKILMHGDFGAKSSLLFRFLFTDSPDEKAFRDVIRATVEEDSIFDQEESALAARWIGEFYFDEPEVILEQLVACTPLDYTPHAFINHLACLERFSVQKRAKAAVAVGRQKIESALLLYLQQLDLEVSKEMEPIRAWEWSTNRYLNTLFDLLGSSREKIPPEILSKKIGSATVQELRENYYKTYCKPVDSDFLRMYGRSNGDISKELPLISAKDAFHSIHPWPDYHAPAQQLYSIFDMDCLEAMCRAAENVQAQ